MNEQEVIPDADVKPVLSKQYYRDKMTGYREEWRSMDVGTVSVMVPDRFKSYFKALALLVTAEDAILAVEERDVIALDVFSNRIPRIIRNREELHIKVLLYKGSEEPKDKRLFDQATNILELFDTMRIAKANSATSREKLHTEDTLYWLSREYVLSLYLRGAIELFELREIRDDLPEKIEI